MKNRSFKTIASLFMALSLAFLLIGCSNGSESTPSAAREAGDIVPLIKTAYANSSHCGEGVTADKVSIICNGGKPLGPFGDDNNVYVALFDVEGRTYTAEEQKITLGKTSFTLPNGNEPLAWDGDAFIPLSSAYTLKLIDDNDAALIADVLGTKAG